MEFNYFWGLLGFLGVLGYVLENPMYYVFFAFFILFLVPIFNKGNQNGEISEKWFDHYNWYNISIWLGSAALMISGLIMMATKTMSDLVSFMLLLGIMVFIVNFFTYVGMDKKAQDERLRKIGTYATTYSWYITLVFISFLVLTIFGAKIYTTP